MYPLLPGNDACERRTGENEAAPQRQVKHQGRRAELRRVMSLINLYGPDFFGADRVRPHELQARQMRRSNRRINRQRGSVMTQQECANAEQCRDRGAYQATQRRIRSGHDTRGRTCGERVDPSVYLNKGQGEQGKGRDCTRIVSAAIAHARDQHRERKDADQSELLDMHETASGQCRNRREQNRGTAQCRNARDAHRYGEAYCKKQNVRKTAQHDRKMIAKSCERERVRQAELCVVSHLGCGVRRENLAQIHTIDGERLQ